MKSLFPSLAMVCFVAISSGTSFAQAPYGGPGFGQRGGYAANPQFGAAPQFGNNYAPGPGRPFPGLMNQGVSYNPATPPVMTPQPAIPPNTLPVQNPVATPTPMPQSMAASRMMVNQPVQAGCCPDRPNVPPVTTGPVGNVGPSFGINCGPSCGPNGCAVPPYRGGCPTGPVAALGPGYQSAMNASWGDAPCATAAPRAANWFGGVYGLIFDRDDDNNVNVLFNSADYTTYFGTNEAQMQSAGGYEARIGKTFAGGAWGVEASYWELFPDTETAFFDVGAEGLPALNSTLLFDDLEIAGSGVPATWTEADAIVFAQIRRTYDFQNIEINLISAPLFAVAPRITPGAAYGNCGCGPNIGQSCGCSPCGPPTCVQPPKLRIGWVFGVRYFRFDESLNLALDTADTAITGTAAELNYDSNVTNDLVGVQLGLNMDYCINKAFQIEAGSRFGLYGNHMTMVQELSNVNGVAYAVGAPANEYQINADDEQVAFLGELRVGFGYRIGCNWRLNGGYRALAASGVALSTHQFPVGRSAGDLTDRANIRANGDLILHGAYGGLEFAF